MSISVQLLLFLSHSLVIIFPLFAKHYCDWQTPLKEKAGQHLTYQTNYFASEHAKGKFQSSSAHNKSITDEEQLVKEMSLQ